MVVLIAMDEGHIQSDIILIFFIFRVARWCEAENKVSLSLEPQNTLGWKGGAKAIRVDKTIELEHPFSRH